MNIYHHWAEIVRRHAAAVMAEGMTSLPDGLLARVVVDPPRDVSHGHLATNAAMVLAKPAGVAPRELAEKLRTRLVAEDFVTDVTVAGPGFINICLSDAFWRDQAMCVLAQVSNKGKSTYGKTDFGCGKLVNVEYVSCNPTGPMHIGHARGAIVGDVLASLYEAIGYKVTREFYINDAGQQIKALAESVYKEYRTRCGHPYDQDVAYPGDYLIPVAKNLYDSEGAKWVDVPRTEWEPYFAKIAVAAMMDLIRTDLKKLGIEHKVFTSEKSLVDDGRVEKAVKSLDDMGLLYQGVLEKPKGHADDDWEPREQLLFKSKQFGDDTDRPLMKSDGAHTYFTSDIAYHQDKYTRGHEILINVLGADHGGYVTRLKAAVKAITQGKAVCHVLLCQMVKFMKNGEVMKMSKRAGTFVTVDDVLAEVPRDVVRFMMLTRKNDAPLDFDFTKVIEQSKENPVFYVQYAHARICSVFRHATELFGDVMTDIAKNPVDFSAEEFAVVRFICQWPQTLYTAALANEPHRIAYYLHEIASQFHGLWSMGKDAEHLRFIHPNDKSKTICRLQLLRVVQLVISQGLGILGITPVEEMR